MQWEQIAREDMVIPGERVTPGTPYFRYENIFNEPQSQIQGKAVYEMKEVVEIRFPANPQYKPVFGVDEMCMMDDNNRVITWAERYKPQYQAFLAGSEQEAEGTPLEELIPYGISQAQLSICRAMNIYSIEALFHLEGPGVKRLGVHGNDLKPMAKRYMEARRDGSQQQTEINELRRIVAELREQKGLGEQVTVSTEMREEEPELPDGFESMSDAEIKDELEKLTTARPRGNPSRATLVSMLTQALQAA